jgi:hypothetical protein
MGTGRLDRQLVINSRPPPHPLREALVQAALCSSARRLEKREGHSSTGHQPPSHSGLSMACPPGPQGLCWSQQEELSQELCM